VNVVTLGPFRITDIEHMTALFQKCGAAFEVYADEDMKEALVAQYNDRATLGPRASAGTLNLAYLFFELEPQEFEKAAGELEKLGITKPSDGSWELGEPEETEN
jgi:hypothetical protein